jgi:hypothetical protein
MKYFKLICALGALFLFCPSCASNSSSKNGQQAALSVVAGSQELCQQDNGLSWHIGNKEVYSGSQEVLGFVENLQIENYSDWRLPSKEELSSLFQILDRKEQGNCPLQMKGGYWLSDKTIQAGEWESYPICGGTDIQYFTTTKGRVMAVRP